jgi:hypothetical protein
MSGDIVLLFSILGAAGLVATFLYLRYRTRLEYQITVRSAIEKGQALTPEFLAGLTERPPRVRNVSRDLRFGVVAVALGLGIGSFGFIVGEAEAQRIMLAVGNVPLLIGLAMIALWRFQPRD